MADINVNTGIPLRWENAGRVRVGGVAGSGFVVLAVVAGSVNLKVGGRTGIPIRDRSKFLLSGTTPVVLPGVEQASELTFQVRFTKNGLTGAADLRAKLQPAIAADGTVATFPVEVDWLDSEAGTTFTRASFVGGFLDGGFSIKSNEEDSDIADVTIMVADAEPTWSTG